MVFRQLLHDDLGCASYLIADGGEAIVVDPRWESEVYVAAAREAGAEIRHVVETHNHADHVSGRGRLIAATGAVAHLPADPDDPLAGGLRDGDVIRVGDTELRAIAAPGHRPEHLAYLVTATGACDASTGPGEPVRLLTGDSLLVGGVARPDLAVGAVEGAEALFVTLRRFAALDPATEVWPAHVGASLCGSGSVAADTSSTIGAELHTNSLLTETDGDAFVRSLTDGSPVRPPRVREVVALNRTGAEPPAPLPLLNGDALAGALAGGATILDVRPADAFDAGHLAGALNLVPAGSGVGNRAGWATQPTEPTVIVAADHATGRAAADQLYAAGVWNLIGIAAADPPGWAAAGVTVEIAGALAPDLVAAGMANGVLELIDVRDPGERRVLAVEPSRHLPLAELGDGRSGKLDLDPAVRYAVACAGGPRAALAASILRRAGYPRAVRMAGGLAELLSLWPARSPSASPR